MAIRAVVFDLGGVLETEVGTDMYAKWEGRLNLKPGELRERYFSTGWLIDATYGRFTEEEMLRKLEDRDGSPHVWHPCHPLSRNRPGYRRYSGLPASACLITSCSLPLSELQASS